ncbi:MAG: trehalose-phosphatase [Bacteroidales bacterium]
MNTQTMQQSVTKQFKILGMEAVILDMDGVITQTAKVHKEAWKEMFNAFLKKQDKDYPLMTDEDYIQYIDGKPRLEGVKSFLKSRNIKLPEGSSDDALDEQTVNGLGNQKNALFLKLLHEIGVDVYDNAIEKIKNWREHGLKTAVVSSSKNCSHILEKAGIESLFDVRVDGKFAEENDIKGKPEPDIFLVAAKKLGSKPGSCVIFEDAISGVQAGSKGNFAFVVGVSRTGNEADLYENGADFVVKNLKEIDLFNNLQIEPYFTQSLPSAISKQSKFHSFAGDKTPVLFLDYDGTLSPIVKRPEDAILSKEMKNVLEQCAARFTVAIVSGRDMDDVKNLVGIENIIYAGSHGFRISGPDGLYMEHEKTEEILPQLDKIENELNNSLNGITGLLVDRKRYAVGVHFRNTAEDQLPKIIKTVDDLLERFPEFKKGEGKKIVEIKPGVDWHKGKAINWIIEKSGLADNPDIMPIYIGDDVTDEDAFRTLSDKGIGILVGVHEQPTAAKYALKNVYQVRLFLQELSGLK